MRRIITLLALCGVVAAGAVLAGPQRWETRSYVNIGGKLQPAYAWCDAPDRVLAVTQPPQAGAGVQPIKLRQVLKRPAPNTDAADSVAEYGLGPPDPGAGQVYSALSFLDGTGADERFFIHTSNVENGTDPAYRMTRVCEFRTPEGSFRCRYVPQAVFLGVTSKRTVIVWEDGEKATYATRNFDGTPGVLLRGGALYAEGSDISSRGLGPDRVEVFQRMYGWGAPTGLSYQLNISSQDAAGSEVAVQRNGKTLLREPLLAFSLSTPERSGFSLLDLLRGRR